ncbi:MAG TPA: hypothetical protein VKX28_23690 [Xanthobacteraceae bacterium]|nr:hypothetical protein [Xanthobacteraceae bacterium]
MAPRRFVAALVSTLLLAAGRAAAQEVACGSEVAIARDRAQRLEAAAASCARDLSQGTDVCFVKVSWKDNVRISPQDAEALAKALRVFANIMEQLDSDLARERSKYDVHRSDQTVVADSMIKCQPVGVSLGGDQVVKCQVDCYRQYGIPYLDCWRGDIRKMPACLNDNSGGLAACKAMCAQVR